MPKPLMVPSGLRWRPLHEDERRQAIRYGWEAYQMRGWKADPPYGMDDPRRWLWQNGVEGAERARNDPAYDIKQVEGWR